MKFAFSVLKNRKHRIDPRLRKQIVLYAAIVLAVLGPVAYISLNRADEAEAGWFNDNWAYRQKITIENSGSAINEDRKIKIEVDTSTGSGLIGDGKLQSDCQDIRFVNQSGEILEHFIDTDTDDCDDTSTDFYVKLTEVIAGDQSIYMYYGNASATSIQKGDFFLNDGLGDAMKLYYPLEENVSGASNTIYDYALSNDGTTNGSLDCTVSGKVGSYACDFGGTGDNYYIRTTDDDSLTFSGGNNTFSMWVNPDSVASFRTLASKGDGDGDPQSEYIWGIGTSTGGLAYRCDACWSTSTTTPVGTSSWQHIVVVVSGNDLKYYYNGSQTGDTVSHTTTYPTTETYDMRIGIQGDKLYNPYAGNIDEVVMFNRALSDAEVSQLYKGGSGLDLNIPRTFSPASTSTGSEETTPGPVGYWKFDEGVDNTCSGGTNDACDSSGQDNNGVFSSAPAWQGEDLCISGKCLLFDGADDYVDLTSTNVTLAGETAATISAWIRPVSFDDDYAPVYFESTSSNDYTRFSVWTRTTGAIEMGFRDSASDPSGSATVVTGSVIPLNTWTKVDAVFDSVNDEHKIYLNGQLDVTDTTAKSAFGTSTASEIRIGRTGSTSYFDGFIDEVKVYPYARSAAEIRTDYVNGAASAGSSAVLGASDTSYLSDGLIYYYKMDDSGIDAEGETITDSSGGGNSGTLYGDDSTGDNGSGMDCTASGKYGTACEFDGTDDYVDIGSISVDDTMTISTWIYEDGSGANDGVIYASDVSETNAWGLRYNGTNVLKFRDLYNSDDDFITIDTLTETTWTHVTVVIDGETLTGYIDGEQVTEAAVDIESRTATDLRLATLGGYSVQLEMAGKLDETRIYDRALTTTEVKDLYEWAPGPVAHYKMDDEVSGDAQTIIDSSGNGNNGTTEWGSAGMDCTVSGKFGGACELDGSDDYIDVGSNLLEDSYTITAWINADSFRTDGNDDMVFGQYNYSGSAPNGRFLFAPHYSSGSTYIGAFDGGGVGWQFGTTALSTNQWYFVAITNNNKSVSIYLDGVLEKTATFTYDAPDADNWIGAADANGTVFGYFDGNIDDVRIYNYARTQKQLIQDMNGNPSFGAPAVGSPIGHPAAYWKFDEGYGDTAYDESTNSNDGDLNGSCPGAGTCPTWTKSGKYKGALDFDGGDSVVVSDDDIFDFTTNEDFTFSLWVKRDSASNGEIFISKYSGSTGFELNTTGGSDVRFWFNNSYILTGTGAISDTYWHYIAVTGDRNGSSVMYVDGVVVDTASAPSGDSSTASDMNIGTNGVGSFHEGLMDDIKIYNYALTADEILLDMNQSSPIVLGSTNSFAISDDNLVGHWKLDDNVSGDAQTVVDSSGNGHDGTTDNGGNASGMDCTISAQYSGGCEFDGTDDDISITDHSDLKPSTITVSMWLNPDSWPAWDTALQKTSSTQWDDGYGLGHFSGSNDINFWINGYNANVATGTLTPDSNWHHVVGTYDLQTIRLYIDGALVGTDTYTSAINHSSQPLYIGSGVNAFYYDGGIDDVRIYNTALDARQVQLLYETNKHSGGISNSAASSYCPPGDASACNEPVGEWLLNEGTGTSTTYDTSENGNDGTLTSITESSWTTGKIGSSLRLDGSADFVDIGSGPSTVKTVSFWAYPETTTEYFVNLTSTTDYISASSGTVSATGFTSPTIYINGAVGSTISANEWSYIAVTTDTAENASNLDIGRTADANYLQGKIDQVRLYDYARTPAQIAWEYNRGAPIAYYKFDECEGVTIYDWAKNADSGYNGNNGIVTIGATGDNTSAGTCNGSSNEAWNAGTTGKYNASLDFDGTDDYIQVTNASDIDLNDALASEFSVATWIYANSDGESNVGEIFDKGSATYCRTDSESGSNLDLQCSLDLATSDATLNVSAALTINTWHHVVLTWVDDGDDEITIYVDGINMGSSTDGSGAAAADTNDLLIGGDSAANFDGLIDDFKVYNYALTPEQVKLDYNHSSSVRFE